MIPADYSPNLNTTEILNFVADTQLGPGSRKEGPPAARSGYTSVGNRRPAGTFNEVDGIGGQKKRLSLFWSLVEHWSVFEGRSPPALLADLEIVVPQEQSIKVEIWANLLIKDGTPPPLAQKIADSFAQYDAAVHGEAADYAEQQLKSDPLLKRDMACVSYSFTVEKLGVSKEYAAVRDSTLAPYRGRTNGIVYPHPEDPAAPGEPIVENGYFVKRQIEPKLVSSKPTAGVPDRQKDSFHEQVIAPGGPPPTSVIGDIAKKEARLIDCDGGAFKKKDYKIATLLQFPEFKLIWRDYKKVLYRDDCGNEISIVVTLPVIQMRKSELTLWAYIRYPDDPKQITDLMARVIEKCAVLAALSGAVVGVALANLPAAIAAFKAVFQRCLQDHFEAFLKCMIPGLAILTTVQPPDWEDFIVP